MHFFHVSITIGRISRVFLSRLICIKIGSSKRIVHCTCLNVKITLQFADRLHLSVPYDYLNKYQLFSLIALYSSLTFLKVCCGREEKTKYNIKNAVLWDSVSCRSYVIRRFGGTYRLRNVGSRKIYRVPHPRIRHSSQSPP
jgi:hypothetical protein